MLQFSTSITGLIGSGGCSLKSKMTEYPGISTLKKPNIPTPLNLLCDNYKV